MQDFMDYYSAITRRHFFEQGALGLGTAALASLMGEQTQGAKAESEFVNPARVDGLPSLPHFAPKAKRAIYLFMAGAPSQLGLVSRRVSLLRPIIPCAPFHFVVSARQSVSTARPRPKKCIFGGF